MNCRYIDGLHKVFKSNAKTLEGGILYMSEDRTRYLMAYSFTLLVLTEVTPIVSESQCWNFIDYYHSPAGTSGRNDWDSMFATLRTTPPR